MAYHSIVSRLVRATWSRVDAGDLDAPWRLAHPRLRFTFVGDTRFGARTEGRDEFRDWLRAFAAEFEEIRFRVDDVAVAGWPWRTRAAVRLHVEGTLRGGRPYRNDAVQWVTLRWGTMTDDWVLEDTLALEAALGARTAGTVSGEGPP